MTFASSPPQAATIPPGWDAEWEAARVAADPAGAYTVVRVSAEHRGAYHAITGALDGDIANAQVAMIELRGKHYRAATDKRDLPAVGDYCLVSSWDRALSGAGSATIEVILPRRSLLVRRAAGNASAPQPLAANVDVAMIVTSANSDLSAQRLDRYLELVRESGITPLIVVSKIDLAEDPAKLLAELAAQTPGVEAIGTSARERVGIDRVRALGLGKTAILIGSSGVGKSSILNALMRDAEGGAGGAASAAGGTSQSVGEIRVRDERGQHTTTSRQLFAMPGGGLWIDTPGMRELAAFAEGDPALAFPDIAELGTRCKFGDCQHKREPGCAVTAAIQSGALAASRLASYHKLRDERAADQKRHTTATKMAVTRASQRAAGKVGAPRKRPPQG